MSWGLAPGAPAPTGSSAASFNFTIASSKSHSNKKQVQFHHKHKFDLIHNTFTSHKFDSIRDFTIEITQNLI
jgi:hypothetical protein